MILINEVNMKWTPSNLDKMENKMKQLGREATMFAADSTSWQSTKKKYLPGGVLTIAHGKFKALINEESIAKGKYGNWVAVSMQHNGKTIIIINIYRLLVASS